MDTEQNQEPVITVLNVNDDSANRYAVTRMLRLGNFEVSEAANGFEALDVAREIHPDVVVLDVNLPDISGHEVCARIKADPELSSILILQLSAISIRSADRVTGLDSGADSYLAMPVEPAELLATIRALLRMRSAEEESRLAAKRWQKTFDAIGEGVALLSGSGEVVQMNEAMTALLGKSAKNGHYSTVFAPAFDLPNTVREDLFRSDRRQVREIGFGDRWLRLVSDPILEDEAIVGRVLTATDLTERRRLEDDLRDHVTMLADTDRRKDEFLAMLGHELRNPLGAISAALYNLNHPSGDTNPHWLLEVASRQVEQLSRLVDDLLDVSRITKGKIHLHFDPIDLRQTIIDVQRAAEPYIQTRNHRFEVVLPEEPLVVNADKTRLEQVISNLVNNAAKYTEPGGSVRISAEGTRSEVIVRVSDTGIGIDRELLPHVFDLFTQGQQSMDREVGGLGIGLTIVRTLVQLHGGSVHAESAGKGKGTELTIRLPRVFNTAEERPEAWTGAVPSSARSLNILLAEDNDDVRDLMKVMLKRRGHHVIAVEDGLTAVARVLDTPTDVALIDLGLPGIDGYEVARRIRQQRPELRLIAVSGYGREEDIALSREAGFENHLVKPVRPSELFESLEQK